MRIAVDFGDSPIAFDGSELSVDRRTGVVRTDDAGVSKWRVFALVRQEGERRSTPITVNIASKGDPAAGLEPFALVKLNGLALNVYSIDGETVNSYSAESIEAV